MKLCASWLQVPRVAVQKRSLSRGGGNLWWAWWRKVRSSFLPLKGTWKGAHGSNPAEEGVETTDLTYFFIFKMLFMCIEIYNNVYICVVFLFTRSGCTYLWGTVWHLCVPWPDKQLSTLVPDSPTILLLPTYMRQLFNFHIEMKARGVFNYFPRSGVSQGRGTLFSSFLLSSLISCS